MASTSISFSFIFIIIFFFFLLISLQTFSFAAKHPTKLPLAIPALVQKTCNSTSYYDLCVKTLQADPRSVKADVTGLSNIAITAAMNEANDTSSFSAAGAAAAYDQQLRAALAACADKYANALQALKASLDALSTESYDDASVEVSSAAEYADVCRTLFRLNPRLVYPAELAQREAALEHLCKISTEMIDQLLGCC